MIDAALAATLHNPLTRSSALGRGAAMSETQVDKVSKDFEALFVGQMVEQMFGDSVGEEAFGDRETTDIYKSLMMEEYGKQITRAGGVGVADYVKRELLKLQEMESAPPKVASLPDNENAIKPDLAMNAGI